MHLKASLASTELTSDWLVKIYKPRTKTEAGMMENQLLDEQKNIFHWTY